MCGNPGFWQIAGEKQPRRESGELIRTAEWRAKKTRRAKQSGRLILGLIPTKYRDDVFDGNDKQLIVRLEVDRDRVFWMEQNLVVLAQRHVRVIFDQGGNGDNSARNCGDLGLSREEARTNNDLSVSCSSRVEPSSSRRWKMHCRPFTSLQCRDER